MKDIFIIGADEAGFEILEIINTINHIKKKYNFIGFFDEYKNGKHVFNKIDDIKKKSKKPYFVNSLGKIDDRKRLTEICVKKGCILETIVSPSSFVSKTAKLSDGVVIYPNCSISHKAKIKENVLINYNCSISHSCIIEKHCNITPGVNIGGNTRIGKGCFIGLGAKIIEKINITNDVIIGANSLVIRDIIEKGTYIGIPVKNKFKRVL